MGLQNTYEQVINNPGVSFLVVASSRYAPLITHHQNLNLTRTIEQPETLFGKSGRPLFKAKETEVMSGNKWPNLP